MHFGPVPVDDALGTVLAHSVLAGPVRLKKGRRLGPSDLAALEAAGIREITVARLEPDDVTEDEAAAAIAGGLAPYPVRQGLSVGAPFTGRANLFASAPGVLRVDRLGVDRLNAVDPAITLATLPDFARVEPRTMVATVKIIPYAVPRAALTQALAALHVSPLRLHPFRALTATLLLTRTPGMKSSLLEKGARTVAERLRALGIRAAPPMTVPHRTGDVATALRAVRTDLVLILTASATSDEGDTGPAGLIAAGGRLERFGMPVDPGNLLFLGSLGGRIVIGLPGCVRSPALNGADWVLERIAAGLNVTGRDIAAMGVGGLLKEIPTRPQPRGSRAIAAPAARPLVAALLLAAGSGRRMGGRDKLLEPVDGQPMLAVAARVALDSAADRVIVVLPPDADARRAALEGLPVTIVEAAQAAEGMAGSLRAGIGAVSADEDAVVLLLADMPEVASTHVDRLIAAYDPEERREICRALDADGRPGHPVLFGRRFFENLRALTGDRGARDLLREAEEYVVDVPTPGRGATLDLDTPEAWEEWLAAKAASGRGAR